LRNTLTLSLHSAHSEQRCEYLGTLRAIIEILRAIFSK
jgi:hypothetical protein